MSIEQIDVVTPQDKPTGETTSIRKADDEGIPHRVVAVFVFDKDNKLLLQVHEKSGGQLDHSVGGHVSANEGYEQATHREMEEEIGLLAPLRVVKLGVFSDEQFPNAPDKILHMFGIFETKTPPGWQFKPTEEVKKLIPMPLEQIVQMMNSTPQKFTRGFINTLDTYIKTKSLPLKIELNFCRKNWGES